MALSVAEGVLRLTERHSKCILSTTSFLIESILKRYGKTQKFRVHSFGSLWIPPQMHGFGVKGKGMDLLYWRSGRMIYTTTYTKRGKWEKVLFT